MTCRRLEERSEYGQRRGARPVAALLACVLAGWLVGAGGEAAAAESVTRDLADPATCPWAIGAWNSASGSLATSKDVPPEAAGAGRDASLEITVRYSGGGFQFFGAAPVRRRIPGRCTKLAVRAKALQDGYHWAVKFKDAKGRQEVGKRKLEWGLRCEAGKWVRLEFNIPDDWEQPLTLEGIAAHNWGRQGVKAEAVLRLGAMEVTTDVSGVSDKGSLVQVDASTGVERNVFTGPGPMRYRLVVDSWLGRKLTGELSYKVADQDGRAAASKVEPLSVTGAAGRTIELKPPRYGVYRVDISLKLDTGAAFRKVGRFSYVPPPHKYTRQEKLASPYGINIHGGAAGGVAYHALAATGFTWIRDYAYTWEWMLRARGADGKYAGWPWYPKMDAKTKSSGLCLLACLSGSIRDGVQAGKLTPDKKRKLDLLHILMTFPDYPAWEPDNEYDYKHRRAEAARKWSSYDAYHKLFARVVKFVDDKTLAVEQGTAGVHPDRVRQSIANGSFDQIDVINAHFYCGTQPPEVSAENANVGGEDELPMRLFDTLRELAEAADSDGKDRQAWITEFGWDTLAGHVVTEREQAAYLQRGFLLQLQAGIDKIFWYWNLDTKKAPNNFFDGCGIFDPNDEPKPASAATAAMVHLAKLPQPVGTFDLGETGFGYVLRDRGRLIACAFKLTKDDPPLEATFPNGQLFDMYANPLTDRKQTLDITPVWIVGLGESDPMYLETAYDLASRHLVRLTAGDACTIRLRVRNNRKTPLAARLAVKAPKGWTVEPAERELAVPVGKTHVAEVRVTADPQAPASTQHVALVVTEPGAVKQLTTEFAIVPAAEVAAPALAGRPGRAGLVATVRNHSLKPRSFVLNAQAPAGWKVAPAKVAVSDVPAGGSRDAKLDVTWTPRWSAREAARIAVATPDGRVVARTGIIPNAIRLPRLAGIIHDADLKDWPAESLLPAWAVGLRGQDPHAEIRAGYSDKGLHLAVTVRKSAAKVSDPKSFWFADCLEVFLDSADDKAARKAYGPADHQFWFCPLVAAGRVYAGRWKRGSEIPETMYDLSGIEGKSRKTPDGYVMELLLPAARIKGFSPKAGARIGMNLNLTVPRDGRTSEVYWPRPKADNAPDTPHLWGTAELK